MRIVSKTFHVKQHDVCFTMHLTADRSGLDLVNVADEANRRIAYDMAHLFKDGMDVHYKVELGFFGNIILGFASDEADAITLLSKIGEFAVVKEIRKLRAS